MKSIKTLLLVLVLMSIHSAMLWAGTLTTNEFIFKPGVGARGETEKKKFDDSLDRIDTRLGREIWVGDPKYGNTVQESLTAIGITQAILRIPAGTHTISDDLIIPANIAVKPEYGAIFAVADTKTLTFSGPIIDCPFQIFADANTDPAKGVKFAKGCGLQFVRPEWWGAKGDGQSASAAANAEAINKAIAASRTVAPGWKLPIQLSSGQYYVNATITLNNGTKLYGVGANTGGYGSSDTNSGTELRLAAGSNCNLITVDTSVVTHDWVVKDMTLASDTQSATVNGIYVSAGGSTMHLWNIENVRVRGFNGWGIYIGKGNQGKLVSCIVVAPDNSTGAIYFDGYDSWLQNNEIVVGNGAVVGVRLTGGTSHIVNNVIYGSGAGSGGRRGMDGGGGTGSEIRGNWISDVEIGLNATTAQGWLKNARIMGNLFSGCTQYGIYITNGPGNIIRENNFTGGKGWDIYVSHTDMLITDNSFYGNTGSQPGHIYAPVDEGASYAFPLCYANKGIDLPVNTQQNDTADTPPALIPGDFPEVYQAGAFTTAGTQTEDFLAAAVDTDTEKITVAKKWITCTPVTLSTTGGLPAPLTTYNTYYVIKVDATHIKLATNRTNAFSGTAINLTAQGTGSHTLTIPATNITGLLGGSNGKELPLTISEPNTTLNKWGTASKIYYYDASTATFSSEYSGTAAFNYFPATPEDGDCLFIGLTPVRFSGIKLEVGTAFAAEAANFNWEYWNGTSWTALSKVSDTTPFTTIGAKEIYWTPPPNSNYWRHQSLANTGFPGAPGGYAFWIRVRLSGVSNGTNGGANQTSTLKRTSLRLATDTFPATPLTTAQSAIIRLICKDNIWYEMSRGLSGY